MSLAALALYNNESYTLHLRDQCFTPHHLRTYNYQLSRPSRWLRMTPAAATRGLGCCGSTNCLWHVTHGVLTPNVFYIMYATVIMVNYANIFPLQVYLTIRYNIF